MANKEPTDEFWAEDRIQYKQIWGEDCPPNELPYLLVFRGLDFKKSMGLTSQYLTQHFIKLAMNALNN